MNYQINGLWSIAGSELNSIMTAVQAGYNSFLKHINSSAVDDAERAGGPIKKHGNIAVISLKGPMIREDGPFSRYFGFASSDAIRRAFIAASMDDEIQSIIFLVSSPGGSVDGLAELSDTMAEIKKQKDIITIVAGQMASAAYYVGAQSTKIIAGRNDLIGSIGTRLMLYDFSESFKNDGIKAVPIDTGEFKSAGAMGTEITERQIADFRRIVDGYFQDFLNAVEQGRGIGREKLKEIADGRMFFASEAIDIGLIDEIGSVDEAVAAIFNDNAPKRRHTSAAKARLLLN